jgi:hypothetical protein
MIDRLGLHGVREADEQIEICRRALERGFDRDLVVKVTKRLRYFVGAVESACVTESRWYARSAPFDPDARDQQVLRASLTWACGHDVARLIQHLDVLFEAGVKVSVFDLFRRQYEASSSAPWTSREWPCSLLRCCGGRRLIASGEARQHDRSRWWPRDHRRSRANVWGC